MSDHRTDDQSVLVDWLVASGVDVTQPTARCVAAAPVRAGEHVGPAAEGRVAPAPRGTVLVGAALTSAAEPGEEVEVALLLGGVLRTGSVDNAPEDRARPPLRGSE